MPWRFWLDIYGDYYSAMIWFVGYLDNYKQPELEYFLRAFLVELESSNLSDEAKCNFLDVLINRDIHLVSTFFANKGSIVSSKKEEWDNLQAKGLREIAEIVQKARLKIALGTTYGDRKLGQELKYSGISDLVHCGSSKEYELKNHYKDMLLGKIN